MSKLPDSTSPFQYVDLCHFYHLKAQGSADIAQKVHETTEKYQKIPRGQSFTLADLQKFESGEASPPLSQEQVENLAIEDIRTMVEGSAAEYGWSEYSMQDSVAAFRSQSGADDEKKVEHNAESMVVGGGSRIF